MPLNRRLGVQNVTGQSAIIIGGSITGLTGALALKAQGFDVTIVERDATPEAAIDAANSNEWTRRGAMHTLQPHVLTARLRNALWEWYPDLVRDMLAAGVWELRFADSIHPAIKNEYRPEPEDDRITVLISRRTTLELVMRRHVERHGIADIRSGVQVTSLIVEGDRAPFTVRGVRVKDASGERELRADVVIDASGRTTKFADDLRKAGVEIGEEWHASNTVYYTRHYRLNPGQKFPVLAGLPAAAFPDMSVAALPADNGVIVATVAVFKDDPLFFDKVNRLDVFESIIRRVPRVWEWLNPDRSSPTSGVMGWANMDFLWRTTLKDGAPQLLGFFFAGDTVLRSNPKYGRGCTCAAFGTHMLADILKQTADPAERVKRYEAALYDAFREEWQDLLQVDRSDYLRFQMAAGLAKGSLAARLQSRFQDHVQIQAITVDPVIYRALIKGFYGLAGAKDWIKNPMIWLRLAGAAMLGPAKRAVVAPFWVRPSREEIKGFIERPATGS